MNEPHNHRSLPKSPDVCVLCGARLSEALVVPERARGVSVETHEAEAARRNDLTYVPSRWFYLLPFLFAAALVALTALVVR